MTTFKEFEDAEGNVDWDAYRAAQIARGEICYKCKGYIISLQGNSGRSLCRGCSDMLRDTGDVRHKSYVRCPHCQHAWRFDWMEGGMTNDVLWGDDPLSLFCDHCEKDFDVQVHVEVTFESPSLELVSGPLEAEESDLGVPSVD